MIINLSGRQNRLRYFLSSMMWYTFIAIGASAVCIIFAVYASNTALRYQTSSYVYVALFIVLAIITTAAAIRLTCNTVLRFHDLNIGGKKLIPVALPFAVMSICLYITFIPYHISYLALLGWQNLRDSLRYDYIYQLPIYLLVILVTIAWISLLLIPGSDKSNDYGSADATTYTFKNIVGKLALFTFVYLIYLASMGLVMLIMIGSGPR